MLDAYIIDSIREEQRRREVERDQARPRIHAPWMDPAPELHDEDPEPEAEDNDGPLIIPLSPGLQNEEDAA